MNNFQLYLSLIFGVIPYERLNAKANIVLSYLQMYVVPTIYLTCFGIVRFGSIGLRWHDKCDSICRLANTLFVNMGLFLYLSMHLLTLCRRKKFFIDFQKSLEDIDECLSKCDQVGAAKERKKETKYGYYATWCVVIMCFAVTTFYDVTQLMHYYRELFLLVLMTSNFPYSASSIVMGQFIYYVAEISKRFRQLNDLFQRINYESEEKYGSLVIFDIETEVKRDLQPHQHLRHRNIVDHITINNKNDKLNNVLDDFNEAKTISPNSYTFATSETNLPDLFKLHDKILSLSMLTNDEFGPQCVPYMTVCFVLTIFGIFLQTKVFAVVGGKNPLLDYMIFLYTLWSLTTMLVAYLVLRLCCIANGYSKQSAMIVHEIMQKKPAFMLGNDVYYNKMKSFTLQFLHWEGYFQFNGVGLFTLDYTFIFSTVSAATSYLIMMLQFDMTSIFKQEGLI